MVTCPLCNALVSPPAGAKAGDGIVCPRCGETFKLLDDGERGPIEGIGGAVVSDRPVRGVSNRTLALTVLGVMIVMAAAGLLYALHSQNQRRENDRGLARNPKRPLLPGAEEMKAGDRVVNLSKPPKKPIVKPVPPLELAGLRYLPSGTDVLAGLRVAELLDTPGLLQVRGDPGWLGDMARLGDRVKAVTGLDLAEVDHVVLGIDLSRKIPPPLVVVVRTNRGYNGAAIRDKLGAKKHPLERGKVYTFRDAVLLPIYGDGMLAFPDDRTVVMTWNLDVRDVPQQSRQDASHLPHTVAQLLSERDASGPVWLAGDLGDLGKLLDFLRGHLPRYDAELKLLATVRTFAFWLADETGPVVRGAVRCADAKAAMDATKLLEQRLGTGGKLRIAPGEKEGFVELQYRP